MDTNKPLIDHLTDEEVLSFPFGLHNDELFRYSARFTADIEATKEAFNQVLIHFLE